MMLDNGKPTKMIPKLFLKILNKHLGFFLFVVSLT